MEFLSHLVVDILFDTVFVVTGEIILFLISFGRHKIKTPKYRLPDEPRTFSFVIGCIFWIVIFAVVTLFLVSKKH